MSFNPNIPLGTDPTLQSYFQLRANFQAMQQGFADNHVNFTADASISGMHNVMTMRPQSDDPTTTATQVALYDKLVSSVPQLFFRPNSNGTPIQMTYNSVLTSGDTQYSFVAGPFIIYFGIIKNPTNGQAVTLSPGTTLLHVDLEVANINNVGLFIAMAIPTSIAGTSFNITFENAFHLPFDVYYSAIGLP